MNPVGQLKTLGRFAERVLDRLDPVIELVTGNLWLDRLVFRRGGSERRPRRRTHVDAAGNVTRIETLDAHDEVIATEVVARPDRR
jgi:hypothetical protein